jgi:predicted transcriptional regulator
MESYKYLLELGVNEKLLQQLDVKQQKQLVLFSKKYADPKVAARLTMQLGYLELRSHKGAIYLAVHSIASILQIKNMTPDQLLEVVEEYEHNHDMKAAVECMTAHIVANQQHKLHGQQVVHGVQNSNYEADYQNYLN